MRKPLATALAIALSGMAAASEAAAPMLEMPAPAIRLEPLAHYATGIFDEAAAEISAYDPGSRRIFVTNSADQSLDIFETNQIPAPGAADCGPWLAENLTKVRSVSLAKFGNPNSVAAKNGVIAVAVAAPNKTDLGRVLFFDANGKYLNRVLVGALPDMITFTPNGAMLLVANEGEPNDDYTVDRAGSISLIDLSNGAAALTQDDVTTLGFSGFRLADIDPGIRRFGPNASLAQDLEPEYIAVSPDGTSAWVTLQENNALALVDLANRQITSLVALGTKDHSQVQNALDASDKDGGINIRPWPVHGLYMPDAIAAYQYQGETYLVLANEGDSRDYDGFSEEERVADLILDPEAFPDAATLQDDANLGRLKITTTMGDTDGDGDYDELYSYGARSFSIRKADGTLVYDSGSDIERLIAGLNPEQFNADASGTFDGRSDDKGPEPEGVAIGEIDGRTYAFIGLERDSGILTYDVTTPYSPRFVHYANTRLPEGDAEQGTAGDQGPEGMTFISAAESPTNTPLLVVTYEVSGSTTVFAVNPVQAVAAPNPGAPVQPL